VALAQGQGARTNSLFDLTFDIGGETPKETTTPVPILRYIDTQNNDGSYTYGYESGDGTYKIETRYATGEVKGKYGYYDDAGIFREVEYGADPKLGFMPTGDGLAAPVQPVQRAQPPVAPQPAPTPAPRIVEAPAPRKDNRRVVLRRRPRPQAERPQVREDEPSESRFRNFRIQHPEQRRRQQPDHPRITVVRKPAATTPAPRRSRPAPRPTAAPRPAPRPTAAPIREEPRFFPQQQAAPAVVPQNVFRPQPDPNAFFGHPAQNINLSDGSYSITYG